MPRSEFNRQTRRDAHKRAGDRCEGTLADGCRCPAILSRVRKYHFDHVIADGLGGKPVLSNCAVLCVPCHVEKSKRDVALIAKAKRREDARLGTAPAKPPIRSAPFMKPEPARRATTRPSKALPYRSLYVPGANP